MKHSKSLSLYLYVKYFLNLGMFGFGGPVVLCGHMHRDLVENRKWITQEEYSEGLTLAQLAPGPLAAQLAIYLGWLRFGSWGAALIGLAFVLPSFIIVISIAETYRSYGSLPWLQGLFYGIGAAVIAIMVQSSTKLVKKTMGQDRLLLALGFLNAVITFWSEEEILWVFVASGILAVAAKGRLKQVRKSSSLAILPVWLVTGISGPATSSQLLQILLYFIKAGAFVFGSGLAIVPFLHGGVVGSYHWLTERQFLDAVAVAMITPGPVVITVAFIGYLVAGFAGSISASVGVFLPTYLFVVVLAPYFNRLVKNKSVRTFVDGVTSAAVGSIVGAAIILGKRAIFDIPTALIFGISLFVIFKIKKIPEPILICFAGGLGLLFKAFI